MINSTTLHIFKYNLIFLMLNRAAAEIHLVHYNLKYGSQTEAINHPDGLAVLAVMVMVSY